MVLSVEAGHTSPSDYFHAVAVQYKAETDSYFDAVNYIDFAKEVMNNMRTMDSWASYLSYDKWIKAS